VSHKISCFKVFLGGYFIRLWLMVQDTHLLTRLPVCYTRTRSRPANIGELPSGSYRSLPLSLAVLLSPPRPPFFLHLSFRSHTHPFAFPFLSSCFPYPSRTFHILPLPLLHQSLVRPKLEYFIQAWRPWYWPAWEGAALQRRATRLMTSDKSLWFTLWFTLCSLTGRYPTSKA